VDISQGQLEIFLDAYDDVPYRVIQFLTSYINYGGRVTDAIDIRTIDVIMKMFCNKDLLDDSYDPPRQCPTSPALLCSFDFVCKFSR
jgi:dynein heavy chain